MIGKLINLPFKVLGKAARAVQDRNDAAMRERHGDGTSGDDWSHLQNVPEWDTPDDFDAGNIGISAGDLRKAMRGARPVALVDVRHPREFAKGTVADAENLPAATLAIRLAELPPDEKIVLVCADGRDSTDAARFLRFRGIEDSWYLVGGLKSWKASQKKPSR